MTITSAIPMPKRLPIDQAFDQSIRNSPFYEPRLEKSFANEQNDENEDLADLLKRMDIARDEGLNNDEDIGEVESKTMGNSLVSSTTGWSLEEDTVTTASADVEDEDTPVSSKFSTLVARHRQQITDANRGLNPAEVWQRFESSLIGGEEEVKTDKDVNIADETEGEGVVS